MRRIRGVAFDLDGTLVNSMDEVIRALGATFAHFGMAPITTAVFRATFCMPFEAFYRRHGIEADMSEIERLWSSEYDHTRSVLFESAPRVVRTLCDRGIVVGIISGSDMEVVEHHIERGALETVVSFYHGGDGDKVPHMRRFCETHKFVSDEVLYVGDTCSDMEYAARAGLVSVGIAHDSATTRVDLIDAGALYVIDTLDELPTLPVAWLEEDVV